MNTIILLLSMFITSNTPNEPMTGFRKLDRFMQRIEKRHLRKIKRITNEKTYDNTDYFNGYWNNPSRRK